MLAQATQTILEAALSYWDCGWSVIPVKEKVAAVPWEQYQTERASRELVEQWFQNPEFGIGVVLGKVSGIIRVDADGEEALKRLTELGGLPETVEFTTPSGGRGYLLEYQPWVTNQQLWKGDGRHQELRIQSDRSYCVLPPSPGYQWAKEGQLVASVPVWMRDMATECAIRQIVNEMQPTLRAPVDEEELTKALACIPADDYEDWIAVGMALHSAGEDKYLAMWDKWSEKGATYEAGKCAYKWASFKRDLGGRAIGTIFHIAKKYGFQVANKHEPITDLGNARVLARMGEGRVKHSHVWGWLAWDGKRWANTGAEGIVQELQKEALEYRYNKAAESLARHLRTDRSSDSFTAIRKAKTRTLSAIRLHENEPRFRGARVLASSEPLLRVDYTEFDQKPFLLNCQNGTLDLVTMELRPHDSRDLLTKVCPTEYDPAATCPRWEKFLIEVFKGDVELIAYVQLLLGYCLTGSTEHHILPIFHGSGRNGKSTLVKTVIEVLGSDYACTSPSGFLGQHKNEQHPTVFTILQGKRFVADLETEDGMRLNEALIKRLTGGDEIQARFCGEDFWTIKPTHKLILATNYEPSVRNQDPAIWGRLKKVPFTVSFLGKEEPGLDETLAKEAPGILRWMVEGCSKWLQERKLEEPKSVKEATSAYRGEQNTVAKFLDEMLVKCNQEKRTLKTEVRSMYAFWCKNNGLEPMNPTAFGKAMKELAVESDKNYYQVTRLTVGADNSNSGGSHSVQSTP